MEEVVGLAEAWNAGFIEEDERPNIARDYLYASELGNSPIDLYLRLTGTPPSNPPNERSKRKMGAGKDWEHTIEQIFSSAGILVGSQIKCEHQYEGLMRVSGRLDFLIGGKCDVEAATKYLEEGSKYLSSNRQKAALNTIRYYQQKYPEGFEKRPIEFKSVSDYAMDEMEKSHKPVPRNVLQAYHYLKALKYPSAVLSYLNRNDERMMEFNVMDAPEVEAKYRGAIETISKYYLAKEIPPREKFLIFDEETGKFSKNLNVSWSNYLTLLYGFKEPREYDEPYGKKAGNWNRVLTRKKNGAKMTAKNEDILKEIAAEGFDVEEIVSKLTPEQNGEEEA